MLKNEQKSAKTLPQKLAGLNKGRGALGENLACGVAWQSVLLGRSGAWQSVVNLATHNTAWRGEFGNETAQRSKIQWHGNKIQHNEFIKANTANGTHNTRNSRKYSEFSNANSTKRYFASETMHDTANTANSMWQAFTGKTAHDKFGLASVAKWAVLAGKTKRGVAECGEFGNAQHSKFNVASVCGQSRQSKNGAVFGRGTSLSLSLSLSRCSHLWHAFGLNLKGFLLILS